MIKAVLSAYPIFQSSLLLAPKSISAQISKLLHDFLWSGGKGGLNKLHLVNWEDLKRPFSASGLQIKDLGLAYLALSRKLLWQLFVDKNHPVSKIFLRNISKAVH